MSFDSKLKQIKQDIYQSIPLIPVYFSVFFIIVVMSPITWTIDGYVYQALIITFAISIVCAYCTTLFFRNTNQK